MSGDFNLGVRNVGFGFVLLLCFLQDENDSNTNKINNNNSNNKKETKKKPTKENKNWTNQLKNLGWIRSFGCIVSSITYGNFCINKCIFLHKTD